MQCAHMLHWQMAEVNIHGLFSFKNQNWWRHCQNMSALGGRCATNHWLHNTSWCTPQGFETNYILTIPLFFFVWLGVFSCYVLKVCATKPRRLYRLGKGYGTETFSLIPCIKKHLCSYCDLYLALCLEFNLCPG